jgi:flagellar hook-length control protein FliK
MKIAELHWFSLFCRVLGAVLQSVTVQASAKVADVASPDQTVARTASTFDLIGFVQAASAAQSASASADASAVAGQDASKPLDPLAALMNIGQLAEKGLKTSPFADAVAGDNGVKIHLFPTPVGATVDTIRDLPMITAADLQHAVSFMPASAEKEMVLSLIHDPQTIAAAMQASGLINSNQMSVAGQDLQQLAGFIASAAPTDAQTIAGQGDVAAAQADHASDGPEAVAAAPTQTDPAALAAQQIMALQAMLAPQVTPVQPPLAPTGNEAGLLNHIEADQAVLPPEITSGPWGQYQTPVMPDQRFVRFIMPNSGQAGLGTAGSLLGPVIVDQADGNDLAASAVTADESSVQSVLAGLAGLEKTSASSVLSGMTTTADVSLGETLASKIAALTQMGTGATEPVAAGINAALPELPESIGAGSAPNLASSTASLFSSIFAKHGIDATSITPNVTGNSLSGSTSGNGFSLQDFAALGLNPLATDAHLFAVPTFGESVPSPPVSDSEGDSIRSGLLKSMGALKTPQPTGSLASQLSNSKQILELVSEEGLTLTTSAHALEEHAGIVSADHAAMAFWAPSAQEGQPQPNAHASSADIGGSLLLRDAAAGGQDQAGGQNHARQDGQSSNQQSALQGTDARLNANAPATDDRAPVLHTAAQADEALLSGAEAHQTAVLSDGTGSEASSFSTASMASAGSGVASAGATLGARESLMAVTYAMTGRSSIGSGSALAAEMRFMSLGQQVMAALKQNSQEIELRLNPAQLGNVVLKLQVEGQKLSISARTESQLSDDALSAGEEGLRTSLAANGYQLDKFDVSHQDERRKSQRSETDQSNGPEQKSDDPFSFDLIA